MVPRGGLALRSTAARMMLDHVGHADSAGRIRKAMLACLNTDGVRMLDLGGKASITDVAQGIVRRLK
jgi:isocitrate/isopropylmalate dehydrogenase